MLPTPRSKGLYRGASALVLPSLYEGFGFTPLEAMSRGCPVVASDIPAVREVSGDGALLVPLEEQAWTDALDRVAGDERLRDELRERGRTTVARYSWDETARASAGSSKTWAQMVDAMRSSVPGRELAALGRTGRPVAMLAASVPAWRCEAALTGLAPKGA